MNSFDFFVIKGFTVGNPKFIISLSCFVGHPESPYNPFN